MQFNFDLKSIGWHAPSAVKIALILNFVIFIWIITIFIVTLHEYKMANKFFKRFRNKLIAFESTENIIKFIEDKLQNNKYVVFGYLLVGFLEIIKYNSKEKMTLRLRNYIDIRPIQGKILQVLSLKINKILFLCITSIFLTILASFVEFNKIFQLIYSGKYTLKIGFLFLYESLFMLVISCIVIIFLTIFSLLINKRFSCFANFQVDEIITSFNKDYCKCKSGNLEISQTTS